MIRVAINGYGRIGRNILRAHYEGKHHPEIQIVAINDLGDINTTAHLTRYDSTHGKFPGEVVISGQNMVVNGDTISLVADRDPRNLPWKKLDIDVVLECTGSFTSKEKATTHLEGGAKKVLISAPATNVDATIVYGVNHRILKASHTIVSNASCTTNCLAPLVKILHEGVGIEKGLMNTIHSYTNDQALLDITHQDLRRSRAAAHSIIPTKTGAAAAVGLVVPELDGKLDGFAVRVPTMNVSVVDFTFVAKRSTTVEEVNQLAKTASEGSLRGIFEVNEQPLVSVDFNHNPASSIFDVTCTKVIGNNLVKVLAWYDNEWGFSNRMLDVAVALMAAK
jgi:glyceraldehyde 3-phosphate dehydrogenase